MLRVGAQVQALAILSAEHPRIICSIEPLADKAVATFGLASEQSGPCTVGDIGLDNWRVERTAAWAVVGLCRWSGRVAILVGSHHNRCQELNESGFRLYCREHGTDYTLLKPVQTFEDKSIARDLMERILHNEPDLVGLSMANGGMVGVRKALRASGRGRSIITVGHEMTLHTRTALIDNDLSLVLAHSIQ